MDSDVTPLISHPQRVSNSSRLKFLVSQLLAVSLGTVLNLTDAMTYGRMMFPPSLTLPQHGYVLHLLATGTSQLIYSSSTSFKLPVMSSGVVESIPFIHHMSNQIPSTDPHRFSTILLGCALSALLSAILFTLLAQSGMGLPVLGRFPQTALMGVLGGVVLFLLRMAWNACKERVDSFVISLIFAFIAWRVHIAKGSLSIFAVPITALVLTLAFWTISSISGMNPSPWLIPNVQCSTSPITDIYSQLSLPTLSSLLRITPSIIAMALFSALHFTVNIPSMSQMFKNGQSNRSDEEDERVALFSWDKELMAHANCNFGSCVLGLMPTYLEFCNAVLFERAGAQGTISSLVLGMATLLGIWHGSVLVQFIPVHVLGFMANYLAIDLASLIHLNCRMARREEVGIVMTTILAYLYLGFTTCMILSLGLVLLLYAFDRFRASGRGREGSLLPVMHHNHDVELASSEVCCFFNAPSLTAHLNKSIHSVLSRPFSTQRIVWNFNHVITDLNVVGGVVELVQKFHNEYCRKRRLVVLNANPVLKGSLRRTVREMHTEGIDGDGSCVMIV